MRALRWRHAVILVVALAGGGCRQRPTPFPVNAGIPLGHIRVQVARIEAAEPASAPEDRLYDVYVSVAGLPTIDDPSDRRDYISNFFERNAWLVDADGDKYRPESAEMESRAAFAQGRASTVWWDDRYWVLRFRTPEASRDFTVLLRNTDVQQGQPELVSVHLGMPGGAG